MAADRKQGAVAKEEPQVLWQDKDIAVLSKGAGWIVAISREVEQNKLLSSLLRSAGTRDVRDLVNSGKYEHLCHYVNLKFREDKDFVLATSNEHEFGLAHRLDVDTSGALMLGKSLQGFNHLRQAFTSHQVFKEYICLVHGAVKKAKDQVNLPIAWDEQNNLSSISDQGMWAKSIYTVLGRYRVKGGKKVFTLCRVVIITGRTHQIRIHMAAIGHPLVGDGKYNKRHAQTDFMWCPRLFLHAWRIGFWDCWGTWHEVKAPLPGDVSRSLKTLEAVQLDLDNSGNPSCRILTSAVPIREAAAPAHALTSHPLPPHPSPSPSPSPAPSPCHSLSASPALPPPHPPPHPPPPSPFPSPCPHSPSSYPSSTKPPPPPPKTGNHRFSTMVPDQIQAEIQAPAGGLGPGTELGAFPAALEPGYCPLLCVPPPPPPKRQAASDLEHAPAAAVRADGGGQVDDGLSSRHGWTGKAPGAVKDQAQLEELCCEVVKRTLLSLPMHQCSVGQLGCMREVSPVLQQMGFRRPTLSKILRDRAETFDVVRGVNSEQIVTLTEGALAKERAGVAMSRGAEDLQQSPTARTDDWPSPASARRPAVAPWCIDYQSYEESCATLVEMGFERASALRALQVNHGNLMEAMDQLSSQPMPALEKEKEKEKEKPQASAVERGKGTKLNFEAQAAHEAQGCSGGSGSGSGSAGKWAAAPQSEEELLQRALLLSQREEEDRQRRRELDESALAAALAHSLRPGTGRLFVAETVDEEEDLQLKEALEQSRQLEKDVRRQELLEEEEVERAMRESMENYELFHASGNDALEETLQHSLAECSAEELEWQASWEAIQSAYNEASCGLEEDAAGSAAELRRDTDEREGGPHLQPLWPLPVEASTEDAEDPILAAAPPALDLQEWLLLRVQELQVELDGDVLAAVMTELEETRELEDREVLKMWLGFMEEEPLPANLEQLFSEFKERRQRHRLQSSQTDSG